MTEVFQWSETHWYVECPHCHHVHEGDSEFDIGDIECAACDKKFIVKDSN